MTTQETRYRIMFNVFKVFLMKCLIASFSIKQVNDECSTINNFLLRPVEINRKRLQWDGKSTRLTHDGYENDILTRCAQIAKSVPLVFPSYTL